MTTTTVTRPDEPTATPAGGADIDLVFWVDNQVAVEVRVQDTLATLEIGRRQGTLSIRTYTAEPAKSALADLTLIEQFLYRCLKEVAEGKRQARIAEARLLPCGGGCQPVTWPAGQWCCSAFIVDDESNTWVCSLADRHDGDHAACATSTGEHLLHRWPADSNGGKQ